VALAVRAQGALDTLFPWRKINPLQEQIEQLETMVSEGRTFDSPFDMPWARNNADQLSGHNFSLREWTPGERDKVLEACHMAWERNPLAKAAVRYTTQFTVGKGMRILFRNHRVKEVIDRFIETEANDFESVEKGVIESLQVDGDVFVRFVENPLGDIFITFIPAWAVRDIITHKKIRRMVLRYSISKYWLGEDDNLAMGHADTREVPAEEILHVAVNRFPYEVRGRSDLFTVLPWLKAYKDWLENRARLNKLKSALLVHIKLAGATQAQINSKRNTYQRPPPPGSFMVTSDKEELEMVGSKIEGSDAAEDGRQIKLMALAGLQIPEYMTGEGENANLATARAQQLPVLRKFADYQDIITTQVWLPIFKRVIRKAIESGALSAKVQVEDSEGEAVQFPKTGALEKSGLLKPPKPKKPQIVNPDGTITEPEQEEPPEIETSIKMIDAEDAFEVLYPELESDDPKNLAQALEIAQGKGWTSPETASSRMGFHYDEEQRRILAAKARAAMRGEDPDAIFGPEKGSQRVDGEGSGRTENRSGEKTGPGASVGNR